MDESIDADKVHSANAVYYTAVKGIKIALFDVSDVSNPKQKFMEVIGDRGTESEVLQNHKAFLFDKSLGLLAFPITVNELPEPTSANEEINYGEFVFQGAYVYHLDSETGFQLKGKITHIDDPETLMKSGYYWYDNADSVQRILYIDKNLYTVSPGKVKATDMDTMEALNSVILEKGEEEDGSLYYPE